MGELPRLTCSGLVRLTGLSWLSGSGLARLTGLPRLTGLARLTCSGLTGLTGLPARLALVGAVPWLTG
ncbi:hypothetical protein [Amycolatopsis jejuensis]|uniref:hypothetical protein n=1 Tax=Amycolatopsis jejuensis TaxID=330084 RepID=UPI0007C4A49F|nr:hypothetical protein [Amycolatopsis jejuensis]